MGIGELRSAIERREVCEMSGRHLLAGVAASLRIPVTGFLSNGVIGPRPVIGHVPACAECGSARPVV